MNIIFLTLVYQKEGNSIYRDLVKELEKQGHNINVLTPLERRDKKNYIKELDGKTKISRFKFLNLQKTNILEKGMAVLLIENLFISYIKKYYKNIKFDLIIYSTPPITFEKVIKYIKKRDGAKSYLLLKDIFPQNAVDLGMIKKVGIKGLIYKYFRRKEEKLYNISDYIGCMSEANVNYIKTI